MRLKRDELLICLRTRPFDLLIIGGGIVGAGIARDAALRGLSVALIDKGDFAGGASSQTSKLIHGGLRYLEHGHVRLVFESLRERRILRAIAPQLVTPLPLLLPVYRGDRRPLWKIRAGLALYDALAFYRTPGRSRQPSRRQALAREPLLDATMLRGAGVTSDCQMDDARLCLANILQAVSFGAACVNYVRLLAFQTASGVLCGASVRDELGGETFDVRARVVVNAGGPWADALRRLSDPGAPKRLAPTKGIHLVLPRLISHGLFFQARSDGRMLFLVPWGEQALLGTTESEAGDLDALQAGPQDAAYLLQEVNRLLPEARVRMRDVIATFAGARPLLSFAGLATSASREHAIDIDRRGLVSVMGGKYTTYRAMAKQALDLIVRRWRLSAERCLSDHVGLLEPAQGVALDRWQDAMRRVPSQTMSRLLARYGCSVFSMLRLLESDPALSERVCPHHLAIGAELVYSVQEELACTISDVLIRRTAIAYSPCHGLDLLERMTAWIVRYGGRTSEEAERQAEAYRAWVTNNLALLQSPKQPVLASP